MTRIHAHTFAETKANILFMYVTLLVVFYHYYGAKVRAG